MARLGALRVGWNYYEASTPVRLLEKCVVDLVTAIFEEGNGMHASSIPLPRHPFSPGLIGSVSSNDVTYNGSNASSLVQKSLNQFCPHPHVNHHPTLSSSKPWQQQGL